MTQTIEQLTARVRELEGENARLKAESRDASLGLSDYYGRKLAAEQLNNKLLRDALEFLNARIVTMDLGGVVERALSLHASTEALDAYVAEKVKEYGDEVASQKHCYAEAVAHYEKQLAAEQLNNKRLRDWISKKSMHSYSCDCLWLDDDGKQMACSCGMTEALAQPSDTRALDAYVAEKVNAKQLLIDAMGKQVQEFSDLLNAKISTLTRQRDLAVEAMREALECGDDGDWQSARRILASVIKESDGK